MDQFCLHYKKGHRQVSTLLITVSAFHFPLEESDILRMLIEKNFSVMKNILKYNSISHLPFIYETLTT